MPEGTVVKDLYTGELLAELLRHGDRWLAAAGGRGGRGNARFLTNRRRAPNFAEQGEHGEERWLKLELQLMADVALVGFPNVGKSTLISVISAAKPKIADYPFTTLEPNLGVVRVDDGTEFVVADIPGLIEGASEGRGLGHQFLRHVERARVLCLLVDLAALDGISAGRPGARPARRAAATTAPSSSTGPGSWSARRPTSTGTTDPAELGFTPDGEQRFVISAVTGDGVRPLVGAMARLVDEARAGDAARRKASCCCARRPTGAVVERIGDERVPGHRPRRRTGRRAERRHRPRRRGLHQPSPRPPRGLQAAGPRRSGRRRRRLDRRLLVRLPGVTVRAVVVKVGTLVGHRRARVPSTTSAIAKLARRDRRPCGPTGTRSIVVSSGAVAAGVAALGLTSRPTDVRDAAGDSPPPASRG